MAIPTFTPPAPPDDNMDVQVEEKILEADFGEYSQRAVDGLNAQRHNLSPRWGNAKFAHATAILAFLKERGRTELFYYQAPEEPVRLYQCDSLSYKWKRGRFCDISAKFIEAALP